MDFEMDGVKSSVCGETKGDTGIPGTNGETKQSW